MNFYSRPSARGDQYQWDQVNSKIISTHAPLRGATYPSYWEEVPE